MSKIIRKNHNVSVLLYHRVCPAKYRKSVITEEVDEKLREICLGIESWYEIQFWGIGSEKDPVQFLVQSVPTNSPTQIIRTIKSLTARTSVEARSEKMLWGGKFWTGGYYGRMGGEHGNEETLTKYIRNQEWNMEEYKRIHGDKQLDLFESM